MREARVATLKKPHSSIVHRTSMHHLKHQLPPVLYPSNPTNPSPHSSLTALHILTVFTNIVLSPHQDTRALLSTLICLIILINTV